LDFELLNFDLNWDDSCVIFEKEEVLKKLQKLNGGRSPGPDASTPYTY